jgi:D-cysteine desulfhydrase
MTDDAARMPQHRVSLATWPTPIEPMPRLAAAIGLNPDDLWIKRDDLTGLGSGGDKVRKLEWTVGAAIADGADTLVTTGAPQSNHARLTAAAGARLGLDVVLVLAGKASDSGSGNIALDGLFGAKVHWAGDKRAADQPVARPDQSRPSLADIAEGIAHELRSSGARPAIIPFGGSSPTGAYGYVEAGRELLTQVPHLATAVVAVGSGGTMAGLVAALGSGKVFGVHTGAVDDPVATVAALATRTGSGTPVDAGELRIELDHVGAGYSSLTDEVAAALDLIGRTEGIPLDPIYTGRALAGLVSAVRNGRIKPGTPTVFIHTGGLPGFFGHPDAVAHAERGLSRAW